MSMNSMKEIVAEIKRMDPKLDPDGDSFKAAVCLISALNVGAKAKSVAGFTGYPMQLVKKFSSRLIGSGIWVRGKTCCGWNDANTGAIAFWCDVNVAMGLMSRSKQPRKSRKIHDRSR